MGASVPLYTLEDAPVLDTNNGIDFVMDDEIFPIQEFDGVRMEIYNGQVLVFEHTIPDFAFNYRDVGIRFKFICMRVHPASSLGLSCVTDSYDCKDFWDNALGAMESAARMYPQQDISWQYGSNRWISTATMWRSWDDLINLSKDDYADVRDEVDDYLDPESNEVGVALVDPRLRDPNGTGAGGKAPVDCMGHTCFVYNDPGTAGPTWGQETGRSWP